MVNQPYLVNSRRHNLYSDVYYSVSKNKESNKHIFNFVWRSRDLWSQGHLTKLVKYAIRKTTHDFLSNFYCHFISYCFLDIWLQTFQGWPWPLTFRSLLRLNCFIPFEKLPMTSYLTSIDTLSHTVFGIFDFKLFTGWPWPLTLKVIWGQKISYHFKSLYTTSYSTSIDIISPSRTVLEIMPVKIMKATQNGGIWPFKSQGHEWIFC